MRPYAQSLTPTLKFHLINEDADMALGIQTNISALAAQNSLAKSQMAQNTAMQRITTGLRINSAKDDAAGLAIADRFTAQIKGLNMAARNASDGISLAQTAEGAMQETTNILQRMRELAVQSANDTNTASDRASLQKEVAQLQQEIDRIATTTAFNGKKVIDGTFTTQKFQVGANTNQTISVSIGSAQGKDMGINRVAATGSLNQATTAATLASANTVSAGEILTISGSLGSTTVTPVSGSSAMTIAGQINGVAASTGVEAEAMTKAKLSVTSTTGGAFSFKLYGKNTAAQNISVNIASAADLKGLRDAINAKAGNTGITAELDSAGAVILTQAQGSDIKVESWTGPTAADIATFAGMDAFSASAGTAVTLSGSGTATSSSTVGGTLRFNSSESFSVKSAAAGGLFAATTAAASALTQVGSVNIGTQTGANDALDVIDGALKYIDNQRADLGAIQNRFETTISNLRNISQNLTDARGGIQDADFGAETAAMSKGTILQQAGIAMLSQANTQSQNVLSLLR